MRVLFVSLSLLLLVQARAEGQTVRVSAVVMDMAAATPVDYAIQLEAGRFVVRRELPAGGGTRLLERALVTRAAAPPVRYLVRGVRALVITRVIAANS